MDAPGDRFLARIRRLIEREIPSLRFTKAVVGVSGGADSLALLHALHRLSGPLNLRLVVAHVDHGLRGEESAADRQFVQQVATDLGLPCECTCLQLDLDAPGNVQDRARGLRLRFFAEVAQRCGSDTVALGHQRDDQAETVLLHLARGCGPAGMAAMRPCVQQDDLTVVRPLLDVSRADIEGFLRAEGLTWREDASNASSRYARNRLRHSVLPALEAALGEHAAERLASAARLAAAEDDLLSRLAQEAWQGLAVTVRSERVVPIQSLLDLPLALQRRVLRLAIQSQGDAIRELAPPAALIDRILEGLRSGKPQLDWRLGRGRVARKRYDSLRIGPAAPAPEPYDLPLPEDGVLALPGGGRIVVCRQAPAGTPSDAREALLDADRLSGALHARTRRPGDRIRLPELGTKSVKSLLIEARVERERRDRMPLVCDGERVLWVAGLRRSADAYIGPGTKSAVHLVYEVT